jgi:peptidoglycan hydrolase-like protein with peptidoglycan-binding domain
MTSRILTPLEATTIQTALNTNGAALVVDGHFGELSRMALIQFQSARGIPDTGNPDPETLYALGIPDLFTPPNPKGTIMNNILGSIFTGLFQNLLNWQLIQGYIRSGLIGLGGVLVSNGMLTSAELNTVVGGLMIVVGVIFSAVSNNTKKKAIDVVKAADASPTVEVIPASETSSGKPIVKAA